MYSLRFISLQIIALPQAVLGGNIKWASDASISDLLQEDATMVTHDKQRFDGRTAIIRRLNNGTLFKKGLDETLAGDNVGVLLRGA